MLIRFVQRAGEVFRVLLELEEGSWIISYDEPAAPLFVFLADAGSLERIPTPETFLAEYGRQERSPAETAKLALIQPLLQDATCIIDRVARLRIAKEVSAESGHSQKMILKNYYRYLATGTLTTRRKPSVPQRNPHFDWAVQKFYFSSKRLSLRASFEMMLVQRFSDTNGQLLPDAPSWSAFRHYFYNRNYNKQPQKVIAREGLSYYQRNCRPIFGTAAQWRPAPGSFQMDATEGDVYLASSLDRSIVIGRPNLYMAVDSATQLIVGIYVGLDCDETAVMRCLVNAAQDKVDFCRKFGIEIQAEQWPNRGLPTEVITDRGKEFIGSRMEELCRRYGMELLSQPPFRPDGKGLVEKGFDLLQQRYKPLLRGKGVIEPDSQERWSTDYRSQAVLTLEEFTQVVIHAVVYLNSGRVLKSGKTPAQIWLEAAPRLLEVSTDELRLMSLPRQAVKLARKGFRVNALWYTPENMDGLFLGDTYTLVHDQTNLSCVYLVMEHEFRRCPAAPGQGVDGVSQAEFEAQKKRREAIRRVARAQEVQASTKSLQCIQEIVHGAQGMADWRQEGQTIKANRTAERRRIT